MLDVLEKLFRNGMYGMMNAVPGTGITAAITTAFSATAAYYALFNSALSGEYALIPSFIKLDVATVPASATSMEAIIAIDVGNRVASGGTAFSLLTARSIGPIAQTMTVDARVGAVVAGAETASVVRCEQLVIKPSVPVIRDQYLIDFGLFGRLAHTVGTSRIVVPAEPVIVLPQQSFLFHLWVPGNTVTAGAYEFQAHFMRVPLAEI